MRTTFSGAHPFRPQCVIDSFRSTFGQYVADQDFDVAGIAMQTLAEDLAVTEAARITTAIDSGICPRCSDPLTLEGMPDGWKSAGSRATNCRCIPVCERCASWVEPILGVLPVTGWPVDQDVDEDGTARKNHEIAFVERVQAVYPPVPMEATSTPAGPALVADDGAVFMPQMRPHPGGWLEHGYDDSADQTERTA